MSDYNFYFDEDLDSNYDFNITDEDNIVINDNIIGGFTNEFNIDLLLFYDEIIKIINKDNKPFICYLNTKDNKMFSLVNDIINKLCDSE